MLANQETQCADAGTRLDYSIMRHLFDNHFMNDLSTLSELKGPLPRSPHRGPPRGWRLKLSYLLLVALPVTLPGGFVLAGDEAYTWKDAEGQVHYGDRPPEGQTATPVHVEPGDRIYSWTDAEGQVQYGAHPPPDVVTKELKEEDGSLSTIHAGKLRQGEKQLLRE